MLKIDNQCETIYIVINMKLILYFMFCHQITLNQNVKLTRILNVICLSIKMAR